MKLFYAAASPYVRKVLVQAHERGLADSIALVPAATTPVKRDEAIVPHNPLGKIPALITDDGMALFDSRVICEYLDTLPGGPTLIPAGEARWPALTLQALADGLLDAALLARYETFLRPEPRRWADWLDGQLLKIDTALDQLETRWMPHLGGPLDIGVVATACALGYLDFRFADMGWRASRPALAGWYAAIAERPSMRATAPG